MKIINRIVLAVITLAFISCSSSKSKLETTILDLEDNLFSNTTSMIDKNITKELVDSYISFADQYPDDTNAAVYLFKAADISMNLLDPRLAIQLFDRIMVEYSDFKKIPQCLFLKGYVFENELRQLDKAQRIYLEFLEKYPDNEFADDVQISLDNLGKSPEELIRQFQEQAAAVDSIQ